MERPTVSMTDELLDRIDDARGNTPRSEWIREACRARLEGESGEGNGGASA